METLRDFDDSALERVRAMGGPRLVEKLVGLVLDSTPRRVTEARESLRRGDLAGVAFAAHALRSSAGNAGAVRVLQIAGILEREARAGHRSTVDALTTALEGAAADMQLHLARKLVAA